MKQYYDARAPEYDEWYLGLGQFEGIDRPEWEAEVAELQSALAALPPARTLDVACGTGFLTQHLPGELTGLDQSGRMLAVARSRLREATLVQADALALPFTSNAFERVFTGHFYGHLEASDRQRFVSEARRVAPELVVVDSAARPEQATEQWQERILNDGSRYRVYKRYFSGDQLTAELGGGTVLHAGRWFTMVSSVQR